MVCYIVRVLLKFLQQMLWRDMRFFFVTNRLKSLSRTCDELISYFGSRLSQIPMPHQPVLDHIYYIIHVYIVSLVLQDALAPLSIPEQNLECRTLSKSELLSVDEMILTNIEGVFYESRIRPIEPPDIYGVLIDGERHSKPRIFTEVCCQGYLQLGSVSGCMIGLLKGYSCAGVCVLLMKYLLDF